MATSYSFINAEADVVGHIMLLHFHNSIERILHQAITVTLHSVVASSCDDCGIAMQCNAICSNAEQQQSGTDMVHGVFLQAKQPALTGWWSMCVLPQSSELACCLVLRPQQKHPCLQLDGIVAALRPKSLVGISQIGLVLIAAYDGLHLAFHLCQLLRIPEDDL